MQNRKCTIYSTSKPFWAIRSSYKPVFHRYLPIGCAYSTHRHLELEIWRYLCRRWKQRQRQTDKPIVFTPYTCAWGNYIHCTSLCLLFYFHVPIDGDPLVLSLIWILSCLVDSFAINGVLSGSISGLRLLIFNMYLINSCFVKVHSNKVTCA